jgi:carbonic anhydrase
MLQGEVAGVFRAVELAAAHWLAASLVIVLAHIRCGAITTRPLASHREGVPDQPGHAVMPTLLRFTIDY